MAAPAGEAGLLVKKSEFARLKGWQPSYVTKLIGQNRIVLSPDGKRVDVAATERLLLGTASADKSALADYHAQQRLLREVETGKNSTPPASAEGNGGPGTNGIGAAGPDGAQVPVETFARNQDPQVARYNAARADSEEARAKLALAEAKRKSGELVDAAGVRRAGVSLAALLVNELNQMRPRLVPLLAAESDPMRVDQLMEQEIEGIQRRLATEAVKLALTGQDA